MSGIPPRRRLKKHEVDFADAAISLEDPNALTDTDPDASDEERFICLGADPEGGLLVTVYTCRGEHIERSGEPLEDTLRRVNAENHLADLEALLATSEEPGPYVFVGSSLGLPHS